MGSPLPAPEGSAVGVSAVFALKTPGCSLSLSPVWCFLCACPPHPSSPTAPRAAWTPWCAATPSPNAPIQPGLCLHKPHPARLEKKPKKFIDTCSGPSSPFSGEEGAVGWGTWALPTLPSLQLVQDMSSPWGLQAYPITLGWRREDGEGSQEGDNSLPALGPRRDPPRGAPSPPAPQVLPPWSAL